MERLQLIYDVINGEILINLPKLRSLKFLKCVVI